MKKPTKKSRKKPKTTALTVKKKTALAIPQSGSIDGLMQLALKSNASMEQFQKLVDMKYKEEDRQAKRDYFRALSDFQAVVGVMVKDKTVSFGTTTYKHSSLGQIEKQIKGPLSEVGLSKSFEIEDAEKIKVTCIVTHVNGHSERTSMEASPDTSGAKNTIQSRASTVTYLQRYTLIGRLGLATADEDKDGQTPPLKPTTAPDTRKTHNIKLGDVLPPEKPKGVSKREALLANLKGSWNALRRTEKKKARKKYDEKYYAKALGIIGCEKTTDCTGEQIVELTKALDAERRLANG